MNWELYEENKKHKEEREMYRTMCWILVVVIAVICFLWYRSDNGRMKWVNELQEQVAEYEEKIDELNSEIDYLKEEYGI